MKHLTATEVMQFVDASADYATMAFCTNHLAVCERCRHQVGVQRSLAKSVRRIPLVQPSVRFADAVMNLVHPSMKGQLSSKVLNNLGAIFGLIMVLSAGGILYDVATKFQFTNEKTAPTYLQSPSQPVSQTLKEFGKKVAAQGSELSKVLPLESVGKLFAGVKAPLIWSSIVLLALLVIDQFFSKKAIRNIRKLKPQ